MMSSNKSARGEKKIAKSESGTLDKLPVERKEFMKGKSHAADQLIV